MQTLAQNLERQELFVNGNGLLVKPVGRFVRSKGRDRRFSLEYAEIDGGTLMTSTKVGNEWGTIVSHDDILELRWLATTATMSDGGFMATLCLFAAEAERARPTGLFIDATEFRHAFGPGVMEWRDAHIIPRYGGAGTRKFAFLMPAGFKDAGKEAVEGPAIFPTKWFVDRDQAFAWLRSR